VSRLGRTSVTYECAAQRLPDRTLMVTASQTLVLVSLETRTTTEIPEAVRVPLRAFEGDDLVE
jgi:acyl-CoA thioesterase FadM